MKTIKTQNNKNNGWFKKGQKPKPYKHKPHQGFKKGNKLGVLNKGKPRTKEWLENQRKSKLGKHYSPKTEFKNGHQISSETRKKLSEANRRESANLKRQIRSCWKYRVWRSDVFTRDNFTCEFCGKRGCYLEADHHPKLFSEILKEYNIKSFDDAEICDELWNINNGRTLCLSCHNKTKTIWFQKLQ